MSNRSLTKALPGGLKWLLRGSLAAVAVITVVAVFLAARLSQGPIDLTFLKPQLSAALSQSTGTLEASAQGFSLQANNGKLGVIASGLEARTEAGGLVARADSAQVRLSIQQLLRGDVQATRLTVTGAALIAVRDGDGKLTLRAIEQLNKADEPSDEIADDEAEDILALARTWLNSDAAGDDPPDLEVIDAVVIAQDGVTGEELWRGHLDAAATLTPGVMLMRGTLDFNDLEKALPLKVSATLERKVGAAADLTAENADLAVLARAVRLFGVTLPPVDGKFTGTAEIKLNRNLKPATATIKFEADDLEAALEGGSRVALDHVAVDAKADAVAQQITITGLRLGSVRAGLIGAGVIEPASDLNRPGAFVAKGRIDHADLGYLAGILKISDAVKGVDGDFRADFDASFSDLGLGKIEAKLSAKLAIDRPDTFRTALDVSRLSLFASYDPTTAEVQVNGLDMMFDDIPVAGEGTAKLGLQTVESAERLETLTANLRIGKFPSETLAKIWPVTFSKGGWAWVSKYLSNGAVDEADIKLKKAPGKPLDATGTFQGSGLDIVYWDKMPKATGVTGIGRFDASGLHIDVTRGTSVGLKVEKVAIDFIDLGAKNERIKIDGRVTSEAPALLALLDRPPLHYAKWLGVAPKQTSGLVDARLKLAFPLIDALKLDDISINAKGTVQNAELPGVVNGWDLSARKLDFGIDKSKLTVSGAGDLLGQPINFDGSIQFAKAEEQARFTGDWLLTPDVRRSLGLGSTAIRRRLTGATPTRFVVSARADETYVMDLDADLTQSTLLAQEIGWLKPKGASARLRAQATLVNGRPTRIDNIALKARDMDATATVLFDPSGAQIQSVQVDKLVGVGNDIRLQYAAAADGDQIRLSGKQVDLRPLFDLDRGKPKAKADPAIDEAPMRPLFVDVDVQRVRVAKKFWLQDMQGRMTVTGSWPTGLDASAKYQGGSLVAASLPDSAGRIRVGASDFGALMRATGASSAVAEGTAQIIASKAASGALTMEFKAKKFALLKSELVKISGDGKPSPMLQMLGDSDRVQFQRMDILGQWRAGILSISKGRAFGNALGLTATGAVDVNAEHINLKGAASPAYGLSRAIGSIPILGELLTGSRKEGVFAANYSVIGSLDDPDFEINPLSALAPGILREIFNAAPVEHSAEAPLNPNERDDP